MVQQRSSVVSKLLPWVRVLKLVRNLATRACAHVLVNACTQLPNRVVEPKLQDQLLTWELDLDSCRVGWGDRTVEVETNVIKEEYNVVECCGML